jgi:translocation and assembly module TamB
MARWLKVFLFALGVAGLALAMLPWWLGAALRPVMRSQGVTFARYERAGYTHFQLRDVHYADARIDFSADRVRTVTPLAWLALRLQGKAPALVVDGWRLQRGGGTDQPSGPSAIGGLPDLWAAGQRLGPHMLYWLPHLRLTAGIVHGFGPETTVALARWENSGLQVEGVGVAGHQIALALAAGPAGAVTLTARTSDNDARLRLVWSGADIKGEAVLWGQTAQLAARWPARGWLPAEARAVAADWRLPAARVKLGVPYAEVRGDARLVWHDDAFELTAEARAEPAADNRAKAPPLRAHAAAHGTLRMLTLTALQVEAPFATATLTAPVTFSLDHPLPAEPARLTVEADLAKMPWLEARGKMQGVVAVAGDTAAARQTFEFKCSDLAVSGYAIKEAQAAGVLAWPRLELTSLRVQLDETSALEAHGAVDWQTREISGAALRAKLGPAWFARWLPAGASWTAAEIAATAEGPLEAPRHQGSLKLTAAHWPPLHPLAVDAAWQGTGRQLEITAHAAAQSSLLELAGSLAPAGLRLTGLRLTARGEELWRLTAPAQITWSPSWQVDTLHLAGGDRSLTFQGAGGPEGSFALTVTQISSADLEDWLPISGPGWLVHSLQATGRATDGALAFEAAIAAQIEMSPRPAQVSLVARGDAHGIELKEFKVLETGRVLTSATGRLPVAVRLAPAPHLVWDETAPLALSASTEPDSPLWAALAAATGLQLTQATAKADLTGTLRQPAGELRVRVARLTADPPGRFKFAVPDLADLALTLQFGREAVTVTDFSAQVDGQAVTAGGRVPMDDARWRRLWREPAAFDWSQAEGRLEIPGADLAPLARRYPTLFMAQGRLTAAVQLAPGLKFSGELHLAGAETRPVAPFGALQDIQADLVLADRLVTVRTLTAKLGGEPVTLTGSVTLVPGAAPNLALGLQAKNLPVVRNTGLLLRTDLDLRADTDAAGQTHLGGTATVRDCLVLANVNLQTLLPTGRRGVTRQPPYFTVAAEPYRHWLLAVEIRAPGVIQVRTTVYDGTASASFHLGGTLGEPRAVGALTVDQGQVRFPFATFKVSQGAVRLREEDPFRAVVSLNATSQRRDYQLRLEMTGELPAPNVTITSTPALPAADVLLLVMTGQPPAGDTGSVASSGQRLALLGAYLGRGLFQDLGFSGEDRLEISAGERVSRLGRETYEFEYKLADRWGLVGEYDEFDAYNAGLKWRVFTTEGAPLAKK